jgi:DNA-directed RNA polymerase specialized sigma24 family protein
MKEKKYYVRNKDLLPEIIDYKRTGVISEELGIMIMAIATNYSNKGSFSNYTWKDDMVMEAVYTTIRYMHNFDPKKGKYPNPFAYITTICHHAFINFIRKQKKHSKIKDILYKNYQTDENGPNYVFTIIKGIDYSLLKSDE